MDAVTPEFQRLIVTLAEAYPGFKLTSGQVRIYAELLQDIPFPALQAACREHTLTAKFFPTVAELRARILGAADDAPLRAWTALGKAARQVGSYESLEVEDHAAATALRDVFGSWSAFCEMDDGPQQAQKRAEFLAAYRQAARVRVPPGTTRLPGRCESSGQYAGRACWAGLLTAGGEVRTGREPDYATNRLASGDPA